MLKGKTLVQNFPQGFLQKLVFKNFPQEGLVLADMFLDWVSDYGSIQQLAMDLEVSESAIFRWLNRERVPTAKNVLKIVSLSKGALSFEQVLKGTQKKGG